MSLPRYCLIDFDDTLATAPITWALESAFPALIEKHHLPHDPAAFNHAIIHAQERSNIEPDPRVILHDLFATLGWPPEHEVELLHTVMQGYRPQLFPESLAFLERMKTAGITLILVSNNRMAPTLAESLGITPYFHALHTPTNTVGTQPKPHPSLYHAILESFPGSTLENTVMVGDDPWSDGQFAENCGLPCYLLDRLRRYTALYESRPYQWIDSLDRVIDELA
jgi:FMN phosphatase YigB (HAD superfamily)